MKASTLLLSFLFGACGDRTVADDEQRPPPPPDVADVPESESDGDVICREGLTACDGECVDLVADDFHCGACGWECRDRFRWGHCEEGRCPSAPWCASIELGFRTCEQVCAHFGQRCDDAPPELGRGCGGGYRVYFPESSKSALEACEWGEPFYPIAGPCSTPIDWSIVGGWQNKPAGAVACCCTQEPPS